MGGRLVIGLAALFGVVAFSYRYLTFRGFSNDHFLHLARAQQILLGELPIRDFLDPGLPLAAVLSAVPQALFGRMLLPEALLVFGCLGVAASLTLWVVARLTRSLTLAAIVTLLQILIFPRSYSFPKILLYPVAVIAIDSYARAPNVARAAVLAVVTTLSFFMRYDHGLFIAAGCTAAMVTLHWKRGSLHVLRSLRAYAFVAALILLPYFLYVHWAAGLVPHFSDAIEFSRAESINYPRIVPRFALEPGTAFTFSRREATIFIRWVADVDPGERRALESRFGLASDQPPEGRTWRYRIRDVSRPAIERIVRHPLVEDTSGIERGSYTVDADRFDECVLCVAGGPGLHFEQNTVAWLYYLSWATVVVGALLVMRHTEHTAVTAALTVMTGLASATFLRSILSERISDIWGLVPMLLGIVCAAAYRSGKFPLRIAGVAVVALTAIIVAGNAREELNWSGVVSGAAGQRFRQVTQELTRPQDAVQHLGDGDVAARTVVAYVAVCTRPSDRLFVFSFAPELFWETQRGFAAGYATFVRLHHASESVQRAGIERWRAQSVPLAIMYEGQDAEMTKAFPLMADELRRRYAPVYKGEVVSDRGAIMVLAERSRTIDSIYEPLGTPCFRRGEATSRS